VPVLSSSNGSLLLYQFSRDEFTKSVGIDAGRVFSKSTHSQSFTRGSKHTPDDTTRSQDLDFKNATKADLDLSMSYSASVYFFSHEYCLPFQPLGPPRAISQT
jgi:hypothetical protein